MRMMRRRLSSCVAPMLAGAIVLAATGASADIYTYTDEDGVVHFSTKPQPGAKVYLKSPRRRPKPGVIPVAPSDTSLDRFTRYDTAIYQAATLYQIPVELVRAVIKVESDYDPRAVSPAGARGLMQMIPATADRMQVRDIFDPRENIFGGVRYLRVLANMFNGDLQLTIAGYNAGEAAVVRYGGIPPYEETQHYVTKVLAYYHRYRALRNATEASMASAQTVAPR